MDDYEQDLADDNVLGEEDGNCNSRVEDYINLMSYRIRSCRTQTWLANLSVLWKKLIFFYYDYAHTIGFSVPKDVMRKSTKNEVISKRQCFGKEKRRKRHNNVTVPPKRSPSKTTRIGCLARLRVVYCPLMMRYKVTRFEAEHNHKLIPKTYSHLLRSHRNCKSSHVAHVMALRNVCVRTCHTYEYMVDQAEGYVNVGFRGKDMYNKLDATRMEIMFEGDTRAALACLNGKGDRDRRFFCRFSADEENCLCNLFWRDSTTLIEYGCFGDVLLFDNTYNTNCYEKPLVLFVGCSNHLTSVVFGCALLMDETIESYTWVLETFLSSMDGKKPKSVLDDGDQAMRSILDKVLPKCPHRLCSWHISKNVTANNKCPKLSKSFRRLMWDQLTPDQFKKRWASMIKEHSSSNVGWFASMYEKRERWAETYCRGIFFAKMRSTQHCKDMNRYVKDYLKRGIKLVELVPAICRAHWRLRNRLKELDYDSINLSHVLATQLRELEEHAANRYSDNVFYLVRKEIKRVGGLVTEKPVERHGSRIYSIWKHSRPDRKYTVLNFHNDKDGPIKCSCRKIDYDGIPCWYVMTRS